MPLTATSASDDDEPITMEAVEDEPRRPLISPGRAHVTFLTLAGIAGFALIVAILAIVLAPKIAVTLLVVSLLVLALVVIAEVVLLLVASRQRA